MFIVDRSCIMVVAGICFFPFTKSAVNATRVQCKLVFVTERVLTLFGPLYSKGMIVILFPFAASSKPPVCFATVRL